MTVNDCLSKIRKATDEIDTLDRYLNGELSGLAKQYVLEIRDMLCEYIDMITDKTVE